MKKWFKILLWMLLGALLLVILVAGLFGWFVYKNVNQRVVNYTCQSLVTDAEQMFNGAGKDDLNARLRPVGVTASFMGYLALRENGNLDDKTFEDKEKLVGYMNELTSICRTYPELKIFNLVKGVKKGDVPPESKAEVEKLLKSVDVKEDPQSKLFAEILAEGISDRLKLGRKIVSATEAISATSVSATAISTTTR